MAAANAGGLARLRDGRQLAWRAYGGAGSAGYPVVFAGGNLNSRLFAPSWAASEALAAAAGARVLAVDRPGYGASSAHAGRSYADWAADVGELGEQLGLKRFAVVGFSSGGPHAAACWALLPSCVSCLGLVSSDAPYAELPGGADRVFGSRDAEGTWALRRAERNEAALRASYLAIADEDRRRLALADLDEATAQGLVGAASDSVLEARDWGFALDATRAPALLWHGLEDADVPPAAARHLAGRLGARCRAHWLASETHTLIRRHWQAILTAVVEAAKREDEEAARAAASLL
jgi:pimeloyl-ACP methyl ester carboxylesterase